VAKAIAWETDMERALERANSEGRHVLVDFFNPGCIGCKQMDAVTYPDKAVVEFIMDSLIPLRLPYESVPYAADFSVKWTPTLIILDASGKEQHRLVGFIGPKELIPSLYLGVAKSWFNSERYDYVSEALERLLKRHPKSHSAPEAIFLMAAATFKSTYDPKPLREAYDKLAAEFPGHEWTERAYAYRLIG